MSGTMAHVLLSIGSRHNARARAGHLERLECMPDDRRAARGATGQTGESRLSLGSGDRAPLGTLGRGEYARREGKFLVGRASADARGAPDGFADRDRHGNRMATGGAVRMGAARLLGCGWMVQVRRGQWIVYLGLVLVVAKMLGRPPGLVHAIGADHAPAELQRERHDQQLEEPAGHARQYITGVRRRTPPIALSCCGCTGGKYRGADSRSRY